MAFLGTFNGYVLPGITDWQAPYNKRIDEDVIPGKDGAYTGPQAKIDARAVTIRGRFDLDTAEQAEWVITKMAGVLSAGIAPLIKFSGRCLYAECRDFSPTPYPGAGGCCWDYSILFYCADPFYYSLNPRTTVAAITGASSQAFTIHCVGSANSDILMTHVPTASMTNFQIANAHTSIATYMQYAGSVGAGDGLIIDTGEMTCTNNGVNGLKDCTGNFLQLAPGPNVLTVTGTGHAGALSIKHYDRWL